MIIIMENWKELEFSEMVQISGGVNIAYEVGYAIGSGLKKLFFLRTLVQLLWFFYAREMQLINCISLY